ncbi:Leucine-rich repeat serine/threonine-protein kinase 2 [Balamuthia mandrillaris]
MFLLLPSIGVHLKLSSLHHLCTYVGKMTALTELDLEENKIEHIPEEIGRLTRLKKLVLGNGEDWFNVMKVYHNKLTELPKNFVNLTSLTSLDVTYNHLSEIPSVFFANCRELRFLDVSGNQLTRLPSEIGCLTKLDRLYASSNKLEAIPYTIGKLTNLQVLCMQNNKISKIPYQVGLLSKLETLFLEDNPIKDPPRSVFKRGLEDLLDYFVDLIRGEERTFRARVLVVGESKTGRSSFVKVLTAPPKKKIAMPGGPSQEDANKSLVITDWSPKVKHPLLPSTSAVTFHIWDFNCPCKVPVDADKGAAQGEDASSSTTAIDSSLFFSEECVYVLVLSCKVQGHVEKDLSKVVRSWRLRLWLKRIEQVRRFEETSVSTIIVVTHADDDIVSQGEKKKLFGALERKYKKHPGVNLVSVNFINNNLKKDNGKLMAKMQKEIVDSSLRFAGKHGMGKLFPRGVLQLEKILQERKAELNSAPAITMAEFKQLCKLCLLEKPEDVLMALRVLRNWGSLLYFEEKPITLKHVLQRDKADEEQTNDPLADSQQLVLSPEWFVEKLVKGEVRL